jgi:hypothetical protein
MNDYYAERRAATRAMYPRTGRPYSWTDPDGILWTLDADGRRFGFIGGYTVREGMRTDGYSVLHDIDGDEVRVASGLTLDEATELARGNA